MNFIPSIAVALLLPCVHGLCLTRPGDRYTGGCTPEKVSRTRIGKQQGDTGHFQEPIVRPKDYIFNGYGSQDYEATFNITFNTTSGSMKNDDRRVEVYYTISEQCEYQICPNFEGFTCNIDSLINNNNFIIFLAVNVSDSKGNWKEYCLSELPILPRAKPSPVENFKARALKSTQTRLTWKSTVLIEADIPVLYHVVINADNFKHRVERFFNSTAPYDRLYERLISGLIPHGVYDIGITVQPVTYGRLPVGLPSDPVWISLTMPEDVPARNPTLAPGQFSITECGVDCITVYWQALPEKERNGVIHNVITVTRNDTNHEILMLQKNLSSSETSYRFQVDTVSSESPYIIKIRAATTKGVNSSSDPSIIQVNRTTFNSPRPFDVESIRSKDNSFIAVHWKLPKGLEKKSFEGNVVICEQDDIIHESKCKGKLLSFSVGSATAAKIPLANKTEQDYRVGVWLSVNGESTGIVWSQCVFQEGVVPKTQPAADIYGQSGILVVQLWQYGCKESTPPESLQYIVSYCLTEDNRTCQGDAPSKKEIGPNKVKQQLAYPVVPTNHFYKVTIYAEAYGLRSPNLEENHFVPMRQTEGFPKSAIGAIIAGLLVLVASAIIISVVYYKRQLKKHPVPIARVPMVEGTMKLDEEQEEILKHVEIGITNKKDEESAKLIEKAHCENEDDDDNDYAKVACRPEIKIELDRVFYMVRDRIPDTNKDSRTVCRPRVDPDTTVDDSSKKEMDKLKLSEQDVHGVVDSSNKVRPSSKDYAGISLSPRITCLPFSFPPNDGQSSGGSFSNTTDLDSRDSSSNSSNNVNPNSGSIGVSVDKQSLERLLLGPSLAVLKDGHPQNPSGPSKYDTPVISTDRISPQNSVSSSVDKNLNRDITPELAITDEHSMDSKHSRLPNMPNEDINKQIRNEYGSHAKVMEDEENIISDGDQSKNTVSDGDQSKNTVSDGDQLKNAVSDGDQLNNATPDGDHLNNATPDGDQLNNATPDGDQLNNATPDGDQLNNATPDGDQLNNATPDGDQLNNATPDGDQLNNATPDGDQSKKTTSDGDQSPVIKNDELEFILNDEQLNEPRKLPALHDMFRL